jgi:hypothetical protein|tara:strand:- start:68 stop:571 length:504 start_codon:yes stop_codon:yes gene_type:complete
MAIHKIDGVDAVDGGSQISSFPKKHVTLHCFGAVTKGQWVRIDVDSADASKNGLGATCEKAPGVAAGDQLVFGIATETLTASGDLRVQTAGKYGDATTGGGASVHTGVSAAGMALVVDASGDDGEADVYASGTHTASGPCGASLTAAALGDYGTNEATVMIIDQGYF